MIDRNSSIVKPIACLLSFSLTLMSVPLYAFAPPRGEAAEAKPAPEPRPSRPLTTKEMKTKAGRLVVNPYVAGTSRFSAVYNGVDLISGNFTTAANDLNFEAGYGIPVNVARAYSANNGEEGPFGLGWTLSVDMRSTAGGLLKSPGSASRTVPVAMRERAGSTSGSADASDPRLFRYGSEQGSSGNPVQPKEAVVATDASGLNETIQRDVDGVLTTPPWDKNTNQPQYEIRQSTGGSPYWVLISSTTTTPDGTQYLYEKHGEFQVSSGQPPKNLLKISKATDRHGNQTVYTYSSGTVEYAKNFGTVDENKLLYIDMPDGGNTPSGSRRISFTWGTGNQLADRIYSVSDGSRTVTYTYGGNEQVATVTTPGGKTTTYGYGTATSLGESPTSGSLLTSITDPRGLKTTIKYVMREALVMPTLARVTDLWGPFAYCVHQPNGVTTIIDEGGCVPSSQLSNWNHDGNSATVHFQDRTGSTLDTNGFPTALSTAAADKINEGGLDVSFDTSTDVVQLTVKDFHAQSYVNSTPKPIWQRWVRGATQDVVKESSYSYPKTSVDLGSSRVLVDSTLAYGTRVDVYSQNNFMGNPLSKTVEEYNHEDATTSPARTSVVEYAYHDGDRFYQQKSTRSKDGSGNWMYTYNDVYADSESNAGRWGQTKAVYDAKFGGVGLNTNASVPAWVDSADTWRYQVEPANYGCASAKFDYDDEGRPVQVDKIRTVGTIGTPSTYAYLRTTMEYGSGTGWWGYPKKVVENSLGQQWEQRVTETLSYDSAGRPLVAQVANGYSTSSSGWVGRKTETDYAADGEILQIDQVLPQSKTLVTYDYFGSNEGTALDFGMPQTVTDGLSGVVQTFSYVHSGNGKGQLASVVENRGTYNYTTEYAYTAAGDRYEAKYTTPNGTSWWRYCDYLRVGSPDAPKRAFQTLNKLDSNGNATSEEFHYQYDTAGRLTQAAFAQVPQSGQTYSVPAASRVRSAYAYDAGGRTTEVFTRYETLSSGAYVGAGDIADSTSTYGNAYIPSKTASYLKLWRTNGSAARERTHGYTYEASTGYLTGVTYGDSTSRTWGYDAAGNRTSDSAYSSGSWSYNAFNQMVSSPRLYGTTGSTTWDYSNTVFGTRELRGDSGVQDPQYASYAWDEVNRLTKHVNAFAGGATYKYRADGMRTEKVTGASLAWHEDPINDSSAYDELWTTNLPTTRYFYDGQMGMEEDYTEVGASTPPNPPTVTIHTADKHGLGARGIDYTERWNVLTSTFIGCQFPVYDCHGNMVATVARGSGYTVDNLREYDPWGGVRWQETTSQSGSPIQRFCASLGHVSDDESDLVYMRARYYEPVTGRFVSEDPAMDGANWHAYCGNDPVNYSDSTGKFADIAAIAAYLLISAVVSGFMNAIIQRNNGHAFFANFMHGFAIGLIGAATTLAGPLGGAAGGALIAMVDTWVAGGSAKEIVGAGLGGAFFGALGGLLSVQLEVAQRNALLYFMLSADQGFLQGDLSGISLLCRS